VDDAVSKGVAERQILLDPGLGFAKLPAHDLALLRRLDRLVDLGFPVLVGASRKRFLGAVLAGPDGAAPPARERDAATLATTVLAARAGAWGVRVHEVAGTVDAVRVVAALGRPT
jgi:dihydropteroate synthase